MIPLLRCPTHPGAILEKVFMANMTRGELAERIGASKASVDDLCRGDCGVSPEMAELLAKEFGTSAKWENSQNNYNVGRQGD